MPLASSPMKRCHLRALLGTESATLGLPSGLSRVKLATGTQPRDEQRPAHSMCECSRAGHIVTQATPPAVLMAVVSKWAGA
jgi:hypothetical protein